MKQKEFSGIFGNRTKFAKRKTQKEYFVIRGDSIPESGEGNIEAIDYNEQDHRMEKRVHVPRFGLQGRITHSY